MAARAAQSGGAGKRPSERIHDAEERIGGVPRGQYGGQGYAAGGRGNDHGGSYGKFSRDHEPYRDAQDAKGGARGCGSTCYDCGEGAHFSSECPTPPPEGSRGYGGGGGRPGGGNRFCNSCGEGLLRASEERAKDAEDRLASAVNEIESLRGLLARQEDDNKAAAARFRSEEEVAQHQIRRLEEALQDERKNGKDHVARLKAKHVAEIDAVEKETCDPYGPTPNQLTSEHVIAEKENGGARFGTRPNSERFYSGKSDQERLEKIWGTVIERPLPGKSADSQVAPSAERAQPEGPSVLVENKDAEGNESDNSEDERYIRRVVVPHVCTMRGKDQRGLLPTQGMSAAIELSESDSSDDEDLDYVSSDGGLLAGRYWRDGHSLGKGWRIWKRAASI